MQEDLLVGYGVLGDFVCVCWCGVEVRVNRFGSKGGILGVSSPGLWFGDGGRGSDLFAGWCSIVKVDVYSCFAIESGVYLCFMHPGRFLVDVKLYRED